MNGIHVSMLLHRSGCKCVSVPAAVLYEIEEDKVSYRMDLAEKLGWTDESSMHDDLHVVNVNSRVSVLFKIFNEFAEKSFEAYASVVDVQFDGTSLILQNIENHYIFSLSVPWHILQKLYDVSGAHIHSRKEAEAVLDRIVELVEGTCKF